MYARNHRTFWTPVSTRFERARKTYYTCTRRMSGRVPRTSMTAATASAQCSRRWSSLRSGRRSKRRPRSTAGSPRANVSGPHVSAHAWTGFRIRPPVGGHQRRVQTTNDKKTVAPTHIQILNNFITNSNNKLYILRFILKLKLHTKYKLQMFNRDFFFAKYNWRTRRVQ